MTLASRDPKPQMLERPRPLRNPRPEAEIRADLAQQLEAMLARQPQWVKDIKCR